MHSGMRIFFYYQRKSMTGIWVSNCDAPALMGSSMSSSCEHEDAEWMELRYEDSLKHRLGGQNPTLF